MLLSTSYKHIYYSNQNICWYQYWSKGWSSYKFVYFKPNLKHRNCIIFVSNMDTFPLRNFMKYWWCLHLLRLTALNFVLRGLWMIGTFVQSGIWTGSSFGLRFTGHRRALGFVGGQLGRCFCYHLVKDFGFVFAIDEDLDDF